MCFETRSAVLVALAATLAATAAAQTPLGTAFTYQGKLHTAGQPTNGPHDLRLRLYDAAEAGNLVAGPICLDGVVVTDGLFTASLDFGAAAFDGDALWLSIEVRADPTPANCSAGGYTLLAPRQPLTPAPYAIAARSLILPCTGSADVHNGSVFKIVNTDTDALFISTGIWGESAQPGGRGVYGAATSIGTGIRGEALSGGTGVSGYAYGSSGSTIGVSGVTESTTGSGVLGRATANTGANYGVQGRTDSSNGKGVYGLASSATGSNCGVYGTTSSPDGCGVEGFNADGIGVIGRTTNNVGVLGQALATSGESYGVVGECVSSAGGRGVYGHALNTATGATYGVYGEASGISGFAVWFQGRLAGSGTKSFCIDHPADPENKYLVHYCTEAPQPLNAYSGMARLDANGQACIELPDYFDRINREPRILLTPAGAPMPNLHAPEDVIDGRFQIAGGAPGGKVFWRVEAVRSDPWVQKYGAPVEVEKPANERGKYQHPELYGQPPSVARDLKQ